MNAMNKNIVGRIYPVQCDPVTDAKAYCTGSRFTKLELLAN